MRQSEVLWPDVAAAPKPLFPQHARSSKTWPALYAFMKRNCKSQLSGILKVSSSGLFRRLSQAPAAGYTATTASRARMAIRRGQVGVPAITASPWRTSVAQGAGRCKLAEVMFCAVKA